MRRSAFCSGYKYNPETTEEFESGFRSGDTLPDPDYDTPLEGRIEGSVKSGVSFTESLYSDQPKVDRRKR